jgi:hypothetical protein
LLAVRRTRLRVSASACFSSIVCFVHDSVAEGDVMGVNSSLSDFF